MGNYINKYSGNSEFYTDSTRQFPNVSLVDEKVKINKENIQPSGNCYVVTYDVEAYNGLPYGDLYDHKTEKWYKLNNKYEYEEYGVIETGETLSSMTLYDGKLVLIGNTEYEYSGGTWNNLGDVSGSTETFTINRETAMSGEYQGDELSTTFKILKSEVESVGMLNFMIMDQNGGSLEIRNNHYSYNLEEEGTIVDDGTYLNYSLPNTQSIIIDMIDYWGMGEINLIVSNEIWPKEYATKDAISYNRSFATYDAMTATTCPNVGIGQYAEAGGQVYKYTEDGWKIADDSEFAFIATYNDGSAYVMPKGYTTEVKEIPNSDEMTDLYIGYGISTIDKIYSPSPHNPESEEDMEFASKIKYISLPSTVTDIKEFAFWRSGHLQFVDIPNTVTNIEQKAFKECTSLKKMDIPNSITSIGQETFSYCSGLTSVTIPNSVTSIGYEAFSYCSGLTSVTIPNSVTYIDYGAFNNCRGLKEINVIPITPPSMNYSFEQTNNAPIYVPYRSVSAYKSSWNNYASRIVDYNEKYLTFEAIEPMQVKFVGTSYSGTKNQLRYSLDNGATWEILDDDTYTPYIHSGDVILFKNVGTLHPIENGGIGTFETNGGKFVLKGNVMSLLFGDNFSGQTSLSGYSYAFRNLFENCTNLISAEDLAMPATTLANWCYAYMFEGCSELVTAPMLPATTLSERCYYRLFHNCSMLNNLICLATDVSANSCLEEMLGNVDRVGVFTKNQNATWMEEEQYENVIPKDWTIVDY